MPKRGPKPGHLSSQKRTRARDSTQREYCCYCGCVHSDSVRFFPVHLSEKDERILIGNKMVAPWLLRTWLEDGAEVEVGDEPVLLGQVCHAAYQRNIKERARVELHCGADGLS